MNDPFPAGMSMAGIFVYAQKYVCIIIYRYSVYHVEFVDAVQLQTIMRKKRGSTWRIKLNNTLKCCRASSPSINLNTIVICKLLTCSALIDSIALQSVTRSNRSKRCKLIVITSPPSPRLLVRRRLSFFSYKRHATLAA